MNVKIILQTNIFQVFFDDRQSNIDFHNYISEKIKINLHKELDINDEHLNIVIKNEQYKAFDAFSNIVCYMVVYSNVEHKNESHFNRFLLNNKKFKTMLKEEIIPELCQQIKDLQLACLSNTGYSSPSFENLIFQKGIYSEKICHIDHLDDTTNNCNYKKLSIEITNVKIADYANDIDIDIDEI